jgi:hypothetical protein
MKKRRKMRMRKQEIERLRKLARRLDLDIQEYDMKAFDYQQIKEQMLQRAGIKTQEMKDKEFLIWDAAAEQYDNLPIEQKVYIPENVPGQQIEFINCLILKFNVHDFSLAKKILMAKYRGNMMTRTHRILEANKKMTSKIRMIWFMGYKETTNRILEELREKHNIRPRILRDSFLRRDFLHYADGQIYVMKKKHFREEQQKIIEKMLH